jgi:exonuclease SbcC
MAAIDGEFPSRDGNIADYATARDAYIDALFSVEGRGTYRPRFSVDGQNRKSDAVLDLVQADGSRTPLNDGKVTTFREAVASVFPPKALRLASAFSAQNRAGSFVTAKPSARKDLFGTLIGLEHYAAMAATAKACLDVVEATRARLQERRDLLVRDTAPTIAEAIQARANALQVEGGTAELRRVELQDEIESLQSERHEVAEDAQAHLLGLERIEVLRTALVTRQIDLEHLDRDRRSAEATAQSERERADMQRNASLRDLDNRERTEVDARAKTVKDLDERIAGNQTLNARAEEIREAEAAKTTADGRLAELRQQKDRDGDHLEHAREQVRSRETMLRDAERAERDLVAARESARTLTVVKFGDRCGGELPCQFVAKAAEALARIPELEGAAAHAASLREGIALWTDRVNSYTQDVKARAIAIAQVEQQIAGHWTLAKYAPELLATEARIAEYQRARVQADEGLRLRRDDVANQRTAVHARHSETVADIARRLEDRLAEMAVRREAIATATGEAERQVAELQTLLPKTQAAAQRLHAIDEDELPRLRTRWTENEATLAAVGARRAELERERQAFVAKVHALSDVQDLLRTAEDRLLVWQVFVKAFGRDGLPTLEIAAAGPTVSNLTNDLLSVCFGTRFSVELITQEPKADGKGLKETFTLNVIDNQYGGEPRDIADLSGGERVIVEEALRAALSLYVNSRNVAPIRTVFRDETTGALDPENAVRYVAMLRRLQQLGGFAHVLYVSHSETAAALADVQIVVTNGQPMRRVA